MTAGVYDRVNERVYGYGEQRYLRSVMTVRPSVEIPPAVFTYCSMWCERCCGPHLSARVLSRCIVFSVHAHQSTRNWPFHC